ncbi:hypothetical protein JOC85_002885 [Bacillus mesophilus]|uniref:Uncharacterized protein n=1 Tax=Bacillus mesophilus TaxID=1808955 RepID=A0A6M0Q8H7_9BACI|nr:hypothetical protein [Bacillus mesophilus]MBM7662078.1 hypothetical protein [Bacillus mesophilus]NEY72567.1 hypothetical protein [Bacillus mesophilus]
MAKSKAKRFREKLAREGKRNPENSRSPFASLDLTTRKTKTKKDVLYSSKYKNGQSNEDHDRSFYFCPFSKSLLFFLVN